MGETTIGGEVSNQKLDSKLLPAGSRKLTKFEIEGLTRIFVAIGRFWKNTSYDAAGLKSSWLEFVNEKTTGEMTGQPGKPSYVAEYENALVVVEELIELYGGEKKAFETLFFDYKIPQKASSPPREPSPPSELLLRFYNDLDVPFATAKPRTFNNYILETRIAHAKHFVVDEFIRVQVIAGGFKEFVRPLKEKPPIQPTNIANYNGFIAGSRYARIQPVRPFQDPQKSDQ